MAKTIVTLAKEMYAHFTTVTRDNGDVIYILNDDKSEWMTDVIQEVHNGMFPDDFTYETIRDTVQALSELENDADEDEIDEAIDEMEPDHRNYQLCVWLADNMEYADEAQSDYGPFETTFDLLQFAQRLHIQHIAHALVYELSQLTTDDDESEEEE